PSSLLSFFFTPPPPTPTYTLSLHDALPISRHRPGAGQRGQRTRPADDPADRADPGGLLRAREHRRRRGRDPGHAEAQDVVVATQDRKSTRLNSSHVAISYAVFCLKKKKKKT